MAVTYTAPAVAGGVLPISGPACTPVSGSLFTPGATTVNCTVSDAKQRADACSFSVTVTLPPRLSVTRFLAFGDSMTWGEDGSNSLTGFQTSAASRPSVQFPSPQTYPGALQAELRARYVTQSPLVDNGGKPLEAITDPTTYSRYLGLISGGAYDSVLIMDGANDLADRDATIEPAMIAALQRMVDDARNRGMRTVLGTLPPQNPNGCCPDRGLGWSLVPGYNDRVRQLASAEGVPLADIYQAFNGDVTTLVGPDGLHPTAAGYEIIAATFAAAIRANFEATAPVPSVMRFLCGSSTARCGGRPR